MAKRKRLTPASPLSAPTVPSGLTMRPAPIAGVAGDASATAAATELADTLAAARAEGRMILTVPLTEIDRDHLVRDRVVVDDAEMQTLKDSLRARGQQTPVELVALEGGRYGLISGWRRCMALTALHAETGEVRFASVQGLIRQPAERADAYLAMVEENEVRVALSYFERARIVVKAVEQGVFETDRTALQMLFQSASRAKRSKIGSFLPVVRALDGALRFPGALGERQGLKLARALEDDPVLADRLRGALAGADGTSAEGEAAILDTALRPAPKMPAAKPAPTRTRVAGGVTMIEEDGRLTLQGRDVTPALKAKLIAWLRSTV